MFEVVLGPKNVLAPKMLLQKATQMPRTVFKERLKVLKTTGPQGERRVSRSLPAAT